MFLNTKRIAVCACFVAVSDSGLYYGGEAPQFVNPETHKVVISEHTPIMFEQE